MKKFFLFLILFCAARAGAQVPVTFSPYQRQQFFDSNGNPLAGGKLCTYQAGTSTPLATYTDNTGLFQNTNPIILDSAGFANVWITANAYRFILLSAGTDNTCSTGIQQWVLDFVSPPIFVGGNNVLTGNNTFSGTTNFSGPVNLNAGGSLNGSFSGTPNFVGGVIFSGNPVFTGSPNFVTAVPLWSAFIQTNLNPDRQSVLIPNNAITGTTSGSLAKLTGAPSTAVVSSTTDVGGIIGICTLSCGTVGSATIQTNGITACSFDGATVSGDYVQISTVVAGQCHDVGGGGYPSSGQVLGRVLQSIGVAGAANMEVFPPDIRSPSVSVNYPNVVYNTPSASTNTNIVATTMVTVGASDATYKLNWYTQVTSAGAACTSGTALNINLIYQDPLEGAGAITNESNQLSGNPGVSGFNGLIGRNESYRVSVIPVPITIRAKAGTAIQYSTTYTIGATCAPGPSYKVFPLLEQLSPN